MYEKIEALAKERGITMYVLAKETNLSRSTFTHMKKRGTVPKIQTLMILCQYFGVPLERLVNE